MLERVKETETIVVKSIKCNYCSEGYILYHSQLECFLTPVGIRESRTIERLLKNRVCNCRKGKYKIYEVIKNIKKTAYLTVKCKCNKTIICEKVLNKCSCGLCYSFDGQILGENTTVENTENHLDICI